VGSIEICTVPLKSVKKTLNQNFWKMGDTIVVKDTTKRGINMAVIVFFLKWENNRPKPITVKTAARICRFPNKVCFCCVVPKPAIRF
jgi:hypothetical protein